MGILSVLGRKKVVVEEPEPEIVIDPDTIPDRAYLAVMEPDVAGISSFRLRFFAKAGPAERFIATLRPDARRGTHAFWAMHDRPQPQEDIHIETLVLVRAGPNSDVVYVVSFLDIESANSFTRFEVKRGLALENVLIYWAAFTQIREEFNSINILTATAPLTIDGSAAKAFEPEDELESIIPEFDLSSVEDPSTVDEPLVQDIETEPPIDTIIPGVAVEDAPIIDDSVTEAAELEDELESMIPEFTPTAVEETLAGEQSVGDADSEPELRSIVPEVSDEDVLLIDEVGAHAAELEDEPESIAPGIAVEDAAAIEEVEAEAAEPEGEPESIILEIVVEDAATIDETGTETAELEDELESISLEVGSEQAADDSREGEPAPDTEDETAVDEQFLEIVGAKPEPEPVIPEFFSAPMDDSVAEEDAVPAGMISELQPIGSEFQQECVDDPTADSEEALLDRAYVFRHNAAVVSEISAGLALRNEGADAGMIVNDGEFASPIISYTGDDETEVRQPTLAELLPVEVLAGGGSDAVVEDEPEPVNSGQSANQTVAEGGEPASDGGEDKPFRIEHDIDRLLHNRRWEKRESPFEGFNSPPGRF